MKSMTLEEIKAVETNILKLFDEYCRANNLRYVVDYGTLLGTVRHKGFIPWDDDIDITMPRQDYNRFIELTKNTPIGENIEVRHDKATKGDLPYIKVVDTRTYVKELNRYEKYYFPLWIDVFPVDGYPNQEVLERRMKRIKKLNRMRLLAVNTTKKTHGTIRKAGKFIYHKIVSPYMFLPIMKKIAESTAYDSEKNGINYFTSLGTRDTFYPRYFDNAVDMSFESITVKAPEKWHERLSQLYSDYMRLPPVEKRKTHCIDAYWVDAD